MRCRYRLVGPHEGRSITFNGHRFTDGLTEWMDRPSSDWEKIDVQMLRFYSSIREVFRDGGAEGSGSIEVQPTREGAEKEAHGEGEIDAEGEAGDPRVPAASNGGHQRPSSPVALADALDKLSPAIDEQWSKNGKPDLEHLSMLVGRRVSRSEVESAAPWMTRAYVSANLAEQQ